MNTWTLTGCICSDNNEGCLPVGISNTGCGTDAFRISSGKDKSGLTWNWRRGRGWALTKLARWVPNEIGLSCSYSGVWALTNAICTAPHQLRFRICRGCRILWAFTHFGSAVPCTWRLICGVYGSAVRALTQIRCSPVPLNSYLVRAVCDCGIGTLTISQCGLQHDIYLIRYVGDSSDRARTFPRGDIPS